MLSLVGVACVSPSISGFASKKIYENLMENKISDATEKVLGSKSESAYKRQIERSINKFDPISSSILKKSGAFKIENFLTNKANKNAINKTIKEKAISYIDFLLTLFFSTILMIFLKVLLKKISLKNIPLLGGADSLLGCVLGIFECLVFIFILFNLFNLFTPFFNTTKSDNSIYNSINDSLTFKYFKEFNIWKQMN